MQRPLLICLTPVKDEAWILERFLKCASLWADHIIVADQGSTDGSREIARRFPKVTLIDNPSESYDEPARQQLLISEARKIPGPKVLMALDADEFLTSNFLTCPEWQTIINSPPGTVIRFQWLEVTADSLGLRFFRFPWEPSIGYVDDGADHQGPVIHSIRVPMPTGAPTMVPSQIKLMHYCLLDRDRFMSRIRWYQCYEYLNGLKKPWKLNRFYHQDLFVSSSVIQPVLREWIQGYEQHGIDMSSFNRDGVYRWDKEVLEFFEKHGTAKFQQLAIWDTNWSKLYKDHHPDGPAKDYSDPRSWLNKLVHRWLEWTQPDFCHYANPSFGRRLAYRIARRILGLFGW
jgi:glycosyltransferase involved in cell wall biosynthesis